MQFVVNDTNIFIDLIHANLLDEFFQLELTVYTTNLIIAEVEDPDQLESVQTFIDAERLIVENLSFETMLKLNALQEEHLGLSIEDCSVWYLSKQNNYTLLTGDGLLRRTALNDGVQVKGILWIFDELVAKAFIPPVIAAERLSYLLEIGTRLPSTECAKRIEKWKK